jgi:hypothetical protein
MLEREVGNYRIATYSQRLCEALAFQRALFRQAYLGSLNWASSEAIALRFYVSGHTYGRAARTARTGLAAVLVYYHYGNFTPRGW